MSATSGQESSNRPIAAPARIGLRPMRSESRDMHKDDAQQDHHVERVDQQRNARPHVGESFSQVMM